MHYSPSAYSSVARVPTTVGDADVDNCTGAMGGSLHLTVPVCFSSGDHRWGTKAKILNIANFDTIHKKINGYHAPKNKAHVEGSLSVTNQDFLACFES